MDLSLGMCILCSSVHAEMSVCMIVDAFLAMKYCECGEIVLPDCMCFGVSVCVCAYDA